MGATPGGSPADLAAAASAVALDTAAADAAREARSEAGGGSTGSVGSGSAGRGALVSLLLPPLKVKSTTSGSSGDITGRVARAARGGLVRRATGARDAGAARAGRARVEAPSPGRVTVDPAGRALALAPSASAACWRAVAAASRAVARRPVGGDGFGLDAGGRNLGAMSEEPGVG